MLRIHVQGKVLWYIVFIPFTRSFCLVDYSTGNFSDGKLFYLYFNIQNSHKLGHGGIKIFC